MLVSSKNRRLYLKSALLVFWLFIVTELLTKNDVGKNCYFCGWWGLDKVAHLFLFAVLSVLIITWLKELKVRKIFVLLITLTFSCFYIIAMEYAQLGLANRSFSWSDIISGLVGSFLGIALIGEIFFVLTRKKKILLHVCCAVCAGYVADLLKKDYEVVLYFCNPNINNKTEYKKRLKEVKKVARRLKLKLLSDTYNHEKWLKYISGLEKEPEKGKRCFKCYYYRLEKTAVFASRRGFDFFATTLSVSPYKSYPLIMEVGKKLENRLKISFLTNDFKKEDGFKKSMEIAKNWDIYRQKYCGCEFSLRVGK